MRAESLIEFGCWCSVIVWFAKSAHAANQLNSPEERFYGNATAKRILSM